MKIDITSVRDYDEQFKGGREQQFSSLLKLISQSENINKSIIQLTLCVNEDKIVVQKTISSTAA